MLLKPKIYITVLFVYEVIAVMLLHCQMTCTSMLGHTACHDWFRYFTFCITVPGIITLICMWTRTIINAYHNRFFRHARGALIDVLDGLRDKLANKMSKEDIERYITAASLYGIRYYMSHNPKFKKVLQDIIPESTDWELPIKEKDNELNTKKSKRHK